MFDNILSVLNDREKEIFKLRSQDFTYKEIASILNISEKGVSKSIQKIKDKAKKALDKDKS